ncbi:MAG: crAss001_48 related protein [Culicoidibacterales bacterium]
MMLFETIEMMNSADFKERFKAEYYQLKIRRKGLYEMLVKYHGEMLPFTPKCPIELLEEQVVVMDKYLDILEQRAKIEGVEL